MLFLIVWVFLDWLHVKHFYGGHRANLVSQLPTKKLKLALWQMTAISDEITLPVLFQRLESHLYVCKTERWCQQLTSLAGKNCLWKFQIDSFITHLHTWESWKTWYAVRLPSRVMYGLKCQMAAALTLNYFWLNFSVGRQSFICKLFLEF